jgi:hypothetical protein
MAIAKAAPTIEGSQILSKAVLKAASLLDLSHAKLARILGLSASTVSRMSGGHYALAQGRKEWELSVLFLRLFRSLDSITGGRENDARAWLHSKNAALTGVPADIMESIQGLIRVVDYLDAVRGRV